MKKNFDAFKNEVYRRRNEKERQAKRKRKRLLTFLIPLILLIGLAPLYPILVPTVEKKADNAMECEGIYQTNTSFNVASVSIIGEDKTFSLSREDTESVVFILLKYSDALSDKVVSQESQSEPPEDVKPQTSFRQGLSITLISNDGGQLHYHLDGNLLTRLDTEEKRTLTESETSLLASIIEKY